MVLFSSDKNTKYKLRADLTISLLGCTLFRIEALKTFGGVKKGELGGYIRGEESLSVSGNAWVSGNALVSGDARVSGNALVLGDALVSGNAWVSGNALVSGDARVSGNAEISKKHHLINLVNFTYSVTVLHCHVQVGCKLVTWDEFDSITHEYVKSEGVTEYEFDILKQMILLSLDYIMTKISEE